MNALVDVRHEDMEMDAALGDASHAREEHVHQHGLSAPDRPPDVKPLERFGLHLATPEQPAQRTALARKRTLPQPMGQNLEALHQRDLRRITLDDAVADKGLVVIRQ